MNVKRSLLPLSGVVLLFAVLSLLVIEKSASQGNPAFSDGVWSSFSALFTGARPDFLSDGLHSPSHADLTQSAPVRGVYGDWWADKIIGQSDFSQITPNEVAGNKLFNPGGVYVDRSVQPNRVYVFDSGNSRVLGFSSLGICQTGTKAGQACTSDSDCPGSACSIQADRPADIVLGQPSFNSSAYNGDGAFQNYPDRPPPSATSLCSLRVDQISTAEGGTMATMASDHWGNFYFPDIHNNRVLRYDDPFGSDSSGDHVWGQPSFSQSACNRGLSAPDNQSLCLSPPRGYGNLKIGVAVDDSGNLWVADTQNNRVLRFPYGPITEVPEQQADLVLGQPDFSSASYGTGANQMRNPSSIRVDSNGSVYVADGAIGVGGGNPNSRILVFHPPLSSGMDASKILVYNMGELTGIELDPDGGLWVNDADHGRLLYYRDDVLQRAVGSIPAGLYGGLGVDRDGNVMITGWNTQQVLVHTPPAYNLETIFLRADAWGAFNRRGPHGIYSSNGIEVAAGQLIVADNSRIVFWNNIWNLESHSPADGVVGQADFNAPSQPVAFGKSRADRQGRLWVVRTDGRTARILAYQLPLKTGAEPILSIQSPLPLKGGGEFTWPETLSLTGMDVQPTCDCLWLSDRDNNRAFRIKDVSSAQRVVDIVLGQKDISAVHCNQGRDSDDLYAHPTSPSQDSLCHPGALAFDRFGNLFVADVNLEVAGNWRLLEYDASELHNDQSSAIFGIPASRVYGRNGSFTEPDCQPGDPMCGPSEPAFNSVGQMVVGFNGYLGPPFPRVYNEPLTNPMPSTQLNDYYSAPVSARFDQFDNLYVVDGTRNRVLIYLAYPIQTHAIAGTVRDESGRPVQGVSVETAGFASNDTTDVAGRFRLSGLVTGTYTLVPSKATCTFDPPTQTIGIPGTTVEHDFIANCGSQVFIPLVQKPFPASILQIDPTPPDCVLRSASDPSARLLTLTGQNFPLSPANLQFRKKTIGELSIQFHMEVNWEGTTRISVDMARIAQLLWRDTRVVLQARITDHRYIPQTDWSAEFVLADDEDACTLLK